MAALRVVSANTRLSLCISADEIDIADPLRFVPDRPHRLGVRRGRVLELELNAAPTCSMSPTPSTLGLYSAGSNARGQLATGDTEDAHTFAPCLFEGSLPGRLPDDTTAVLDIACGANHTLVLLERSGTREVWGCGDGRRGQLGPSHDREGSTAFRPLDLSHVEGLEGYVPRAVAAGWETSYVVLSSPAKSDVLISMGADDFGNLGIGGGKGLAAAHSIHRVPLLSAFPELPEGEQILNVRSLGAGPHHVVAAVSLTMADGPTTEALVGWGTARHGQLGDAMPNKQKGAPIQTSPRAIHMAGERLAPGTVSHSALGNQHTVFLHSAAKVSGMGSNRKSQIELLETVEDACDVACTWNGTYLLIRSGSRDEIVATGSNNHGQLGRGTVGTSGALARVDFPPSMGLRRILKLACGSEHVLCLVEVDSHETTRREVWGWGWNEHGNLGLRTTEDAHVPVRIWPAEGSIAVGRPLSVWGGNGTSWILIER